MLLILRAVFLCSCGDANLLRLRSALCTMLPSPPPPCFHLHQSNKLEPDARNNPYNHGCGETEVHVKAIVDTFPFVMHDRSPGHYAPKYKKAVMKFQIDVTFLGRIARLSRWYEGSVHDGTIYQDTKSCATRCCSPFRCPTSSPSRV